MRVRTDGKRLEIVEAAAALFVEQGYDRTSMSAISERVGGSKATLYGYFASKEELLRAVLEHEIAQEAAQLASLLPAGENLRAELIALGAHYLTHRLSDLPITNLRTVVNQPTASGIGQDYYANVLQPAWEVLANHFASLMERGHLRRADSWTAAMHWRALNECDVLERRLLGVIEGPGDAEVMGIAAGATDAFLRIYGL